MKPKPADRSNAAPLSLLVEGELDDLVGAEDRVRRELWDRALLDPAREFLARPGKRVRGRLVELAWRLAGGAGEPPPELALAVEVLHAGSLIVDDIEDGSVERRGAPALHHTRGLSTALNTGNWFYFLGLDLVGRLDLEPDALVALNRRAVRTLLRCHHGQALDLSVRVSELPRRDVAGVVGSITSLKTGALMELAAALGAVAAGAASGPASALARFGRDFGVALQMLDDLSSVASESRRAKGREDLALLRVTWPWAWLAEEQGDVPYARVQARAGGVATGDPPDPVLDQMRDAVAERGRFAVRAHIQPAFEALHDVVGASEHLEVAWREFQHMEHSFVG